MQALFPKVKVTAVDDPDPDDPLFSRSDTVRVTLADGTVLAGEPVRHAKGHARNPVGMDELRAKFENCIGQALDSASGARLFDRLSGLEKLPIAAALYT